MAGCYGFIRIPNGSRGLILALYTFYIAELSTPGFFVTADIMYEGEEFPVDIKAFIIDKLALIETGISARKFTFHSGGWRIHLTFFPTDRVVDERYALKNKMIKWGKYKK